MHAPFSVRDGRGGLSLPPESRVNLIAGPEAFIESQSLHRPRVGSRDRPLLLQSQILRSQGGPVHLGGPDRVTGRNEPAPIPHINGRKLETPLWRDTFVLTGTDDDSIIFESNFDDFTGKFVEHCHVLSHEDLGMMEALEVID